MNRYTGGGRSGFLPILSSEEREAQDKIANAVRDRIRAYIDQNSQAQEWWVSFRKVRAAHRIQEEPDSRLYFEIEDALHDFIAPDTLRLHFSWGINRLYYSGYREQHESSEADNA